MNESIDRRMHRLREQIKNYIREVLDEMAAMDEESSTGTGASMSPGSGETYATPNAFVGGSAKNPKKKKYAVVKKKFGTY